MRNFTKFDGLNSKLGNDYRVLRAYFETQHYKAHYLYLVQMIIVVAAKTLNHY